MFEDAFKYQVNSSSIYW